MPSHPVVTPAEWLRARQELLREEKEFTRLRDELSRKRRALPWVRMEKGYSFDGASAGMTLRDLFEGRRQLVIYHLMFEPGATEACPLCSFWADNFERNAIHLAHRDVTMAAVSRAPLPALRSYAARLGWTFPWYSSFGTDFNPDFGVTQTQAGIDSGAGRYNYAPASRPGEAPGISVFYREEDGTVYHTYSCYARGLDMMNAAYHYLDLVPLGRNEDDLPFTMTWVRRRDQYDR